eukprot:gene11260-biopygen5633
MLDLIVDGIQLLQVIYTLRKQLNDKQEACLLLCDRVRIFDSWLQEWAGKDRFPDNASLEMSIQSLLTLLTEIDEFVRKSIEKRGSVWGQAKRATKKVLFRQTVAESLNDFHRRIDQCASLLNISLLTMSTEDKRREEMVALRNELNAQSEDLMAELRELKSDPGKLKELLEPLSEEVGEGNVGILREIKSLQQKVESQDPLSLRDLGGLEESLKASNEALAAKMDKHYEEVVRVKEEVMAVRQTGDVILEKVNEVNVMMKKLLEDQALTKAEEQYRGKLLKKLLIPSGKVRVIEGGVKLGAGGFGEVYVALYQNKQVAVKSFFSLRGSTTAMTQRDIAAVENEVLLMGGYLGPHPTIVSCYGYFKDEHQNISMVLELAPYGCLLSLLEDHERFPILSFRLVLGWLNDAIGALSFIHEHEVKHRDVKADNLLVFHNLHVKLCDFGLAKQHSADLKELCKNSFESPEEANGWYLNGVTKVEHLREIGDNKSREPILNNVLDELQRMKKEGVSVDLMKRIRRKLLLSMVKSSLRQMVESGEVSVLQELEALGSIANIPAEDINRGFKADLGDKKWDKGLEGVTALHISAAKGNAEIVRLLLLHPEIAVDAMDSKSLHD